MKSISKLKDEARRYEQREEWEKAIQTYLEVLRSADETDAEVELPLYNRLGDLCVRLGRAEDAVQHYEQAADRYAEAGLYNNAIALCNKALRYSRDRPELIRKLGQFSASQGFITDARRYFLDYAERQFNAGRVDDALSALEDFADVADDAEVREMLGRRMHAHGRREGAVRELQRAYAMRVRDGETARAEALLAELQAMDPNAAAAAGAAAAGPAVSAAPRDADDLPYVHPDSDFEVARFEDPGAARVEGLEPGELEPPSPPHSPVIEGLEHTVESTDFAIDTSGIEGLETDSVDFSDVDAQTESVDIMRGETSFGDSLLPADTAGESFDLPLLDDEPESAADDLPLLDDELESAADDLPLLEDELPESAADALPLLDDEPPGSAVHDLPFLDDEPPISAADDVPLLDNRRREATPPPAPQVEDSFAPIDLGTDFSFDLGGFGTMQPKADVPSLDDVPAPPAGADDDGIALPDIDVDADFDFDVKPTTAEPTSRQVDAPRDDIALPELEEDDAVAGMDGAEADELQTFDGEAELDSAPLMWEPEPAPSFELPSFEPEPSGYDEVLPETYEEGTDDLIEEQRAGAAALPVEELAEVEEPETFDLPELPDLDEDVDVPLPLLEEPADAAGAAVAEAPPEEEPAAPVEIPAIELPTWDLEAPRAETTEAPSEPAPAATDDWLRDLEEADTAAAGDVVASSDDETERVWLEDMGWEAAAVDEEIAAPEPLPSADAAESSVEDVEAVTARTEEAQREMAAAPPAAAADDGFIDLGALVTEDDEKGTTRFRIRETAPTGDEDRDFAELLNQFKAKVHEHLPAEDAAAHYDLGLAFKEMGLIDEAIGEFQIALRAGHMRLRVYEELGQCFLIKEQYNIAEKVLSRALRMKFDDELELLGVYYHLGRAYEALGRKDDARDAYERVLGMDINFEDVTTRLARL